MKALPPIPDSLPSILGPVPVTIEEGLATQANVECLGIFRPESRSVAISSPLDPIVAWQTYWHEWVHVALFDAGAQLSKRDEEAVCDAVALARVRAMLDG